MEEYEFLDPMTPREYLEACRRIVTTLEELWDKLPDGNGVDGTLCEENQTKTDMFIILSGCADMAIKAIKEANDLKKLIDQL